MEQDPSDQTVEELNNEIMETLHAHIDLMNERVKTSKETIVKLQAHMQIMNEISETNQQRIGVFQEEINIYKDVLSQRDDEIEKLKKDKINLLEQLIYLKQNSCKPNEN
jgi:chromosome segregation ATPase